MRRTAVVLIVLLMVGIVSCVVGCKDSATKAGGEEEGMTTKELRERGPQPPSGKKGQGGTSGKPSGPKAGGG